MQDTGRQADQPHGKRLTAAMLHNSARIRSPRHCLGRQCRSGPPNLVCARNNRPRPSRNRLPGVTFPQPDTRTAALNAPQERHHQGVSMTQEKKTAFLDLTWGDIDRWTGARIARRGERYMHQGRVVDLALFEDNVLLATVRGTGTYQTAVIMQPAGTPASMCSCPFGLDCKHGVAAVLEYLARHGEGRRIPEAKPDDDRLRLLEALEEEYDDFLDEPPESAPSPTPAECGLRGRLEEASRDELLSLLLEVADRLPRAGEYLADRLSLREGEADRVTDRIRKLIRELPCPVWGDDLYDPDESTWTIDEVSRGMKALLDDGRCEEVLSLGSELMEVTPALIEQGYAGDEIDMALEECIDCFSRALREASLPAARKLEHAVDVRLGDEYCLWSSVADYLEEEHPGEAWSAMADRLLERLESRPAEAGSDRGGHSREYRRQRLVQEAEEALWKAGRTEESIRLCRREAERTDDYVRLARRLIESGRYGKARRWIDRGIRAAEGGHSVMFGQYLVLLREMHERKESWPEVAALCVYNFVRGSGDSSYLKARSAAERAGCWREVRPALLEFLREGTLPWKTASWPLPEPGLPLDPPDPDRFPLLDVLTEAAILEEDTEQVLHWYDLLVDRRGFCRGEWGLHDRTAEALRGHRPDRTVRIWQAMAEELINRVKVSVYPTAVEYLRKVKELLEELQRGDEWREYVEGLRREHRRKRRFLEELKRIDDRPTVDEGRLV